ncbi:MAG: response regulator [Verrucomicrobia bacterium]|nr:response regulator [Verrucomicrobiota bacterium]MDE3098098.1 response regulator [Verrucomicrobiota bacterium]
MKKILIIDDEEWLREMMHMALSQKGFEVIEAADGMEGIEKARKELPDLILCDINMSRVDGYLTLAELRKEAHTAAIPFILMTGLVDSGGGMRHGMELGADDYLNKPFTADVLYAAVEARLKKSQTLRDAAEQKLRHLRDNISMMMPHEMRTPLNGILSNAELLAHSSETLKPAEIAEIGQEIHTSSEQLARLIENFLIIAQLELIAADPKNVAALRAGRTEHPAEVIQKHAVDQANHAGRATDMSVQAADVPMPIAEDYISKIVDELAQNALKFSKAGSPVAVTLAQSGNSVVLSVTDRGRGFSPEQISRVGAYAQFDRKLHEQQGLGLGLSIAKRLVELHGGALSIASEKDNGAVISAKFPQVQ